MDLEGILKSIETHTNKRFINIKKLDKEDKLRARDKYLLEDSNKNKYMLEVATDNISKFYLRREIDFQNKFRKFSTKFNLNIPITYGTEQGNFYALYKYYESYEYIKDESVIKKLLQFYKSFTQTVEINEESINKILTSFLNAWPSNYHPFIKRQEEFRRYKDILKKYKTIKVAFEHGDFTFNNLIRVNDKIFLLDFEFARDFQPIGFDIYDFFMSLGKDPDCEIFYPELHKIKYELINKINKKIDKRETDIEIYSSTDDLVLIENWEHLYKEHGSKYNLSYKWCKAWLNNFGGKDLKPYIFTIWEGNQLVLLAPLYEKKGRLYLIGTNPDLYDNFDILYTEEKYVKKFLDYIFQAGFEIEFKYLNSDTHFAKMLIKYLYQKEIFYESEVIDTNPKVYLADFTIRKKEKNDIKRLKNKIKKLFNDEVVFEFSISDPENFGGKLIMLHKERWQGGPFEKVENLENFVKEIISYKDLSSISLLAMKKSGEILAMHVGYKNPDNGIVSYMPIYNVKYKHVSPGKILLYEILNYCKNSDIRYFDFGRGAEEYKYWFANDDSILFNIKTYKKRNILIKTKNLINRIIDKILRKLYA